MEDVIEVVGRGSAGGDPDQVVLELRVECPAPSVAAALGQLSDRVEAVLVAARRVDPPVGQVVTTGVGVHPRHSRDGAVAGHTAYQQLRVSAASPARAGDLVMVLGEAAGDSLSVSSMELTVGDTTSLLDQARQEAFADAQERADLYARLAARQLGRVRSVSEILPDRPPMPRMAVAADASMPVQPGQHEVTVSLRVVWALG